MHPSTCDLLLLLLHTTVTPHLRTELGQVYNKLLKKTKTEKIVLTLKVLVVTIDAQWEGMGDVGSARYEPALLPPCPTIRVLSCSN